MINIIDIKGIVVLFYFLQGIVWEYLPGQEGIQVNILPISAFSYPIKRMSTDYYNFMSEVEKFRISIGKILPYNGFVNLFVVLLLVLNRSSDHEEYNFTQIKFCPDNVALLL